ncbi:MAG TPA: hypothetical protein VGB44_10750 [Flavobacterium sp.]
MHSTTEAVAEVYDLISSSDCHRKSREICRDFFLNNKNYISNLLNTAFDVKDAFYFKACWILELVAESDLSIISPHLNRFCDVLPHVAHDGALRSVSKICMILTQKLAASPQTPSPFLTEENLTKITESCFKWLVDDEKVATKAYAMRALYEIGKFQPEIHAELIDAVSHGYANHSFAYKAASKDILRRIEKSHKSLL